MSQLILALGVLLAAGAACLARDRARAAMSFLVFGTLLSLWWAQEGAPDVALAEATLGTGVTAALFLDALTRTSSRRGSGTAARHVPRRRPHAPGTDVGPTADAGPGAPTRSRAGTGPAAVPAGEPRRGPPALLVLLVAAAVAFGAGQALRRFTDPPGDRPVSVEQAPRGLGGLLHEHAASLGVEHPITAVLLHVRSYDTLLETVVLLTAAVIVLVVSEATPAGRLAAPETYVRFFAVAVTPMLVLLAVWLLFAGSSRSGGAFQAGALFAGTWILLHLAGLRSVGTAGRITEGLLLAGTTAFLVIAAVGALLRGSWLSLDPGWAEPVIVATETALALSVGASLAIAFLTLGRTSPSRLDVEPDGTEHRDPRRADTGRGRARPSPTTSGAADEGDRT